MWTPLWWTAIGCGGHDLVVQWSFANIQDGYDHDNRMDVYVDGAKLAESEVAAQSAGGRLVVTVPPGEHEVRVVSMALYEGNWEEHTVANDYSIDCEWSDTVSGGEKEKVRLVFDIDSGTLVR